MGRAHEVCTWNSWKRERRLTREEQSYSACWLILSELLEKRRGFKVGQMVECGVLKTLAGIQSFGAFLRASTSRYILSGVFFDAMFAELSMETEHEEGGVQRDRTSTKAEDDRAYSRVQVVSYPPPPRRAALSCEGTLHTKTERQGWYFFLQWGNIPPTGPNRVVVVFFILCRKHCFMEGGWRLGRK